MSSNRKINTRYEEQADQVSKLGSSVVQNTNGNVTQINSSNQNLYSSYVGGQTQITQSPRNGLLIREEPDQVQQVDMIHGEDEIQESMSLELKVK